MHGRQATAPATMRVLQRGALLGAGGAAGPGPRHRGRGGHPGLSLLIIRPAASPLGDGTGPWCLAPRPALRRCSINVGGEAGG